MLCSKCGTNLNDSDQFCPNCGAAVHAATSDAQPAQQPTPQYGQQPMPQYGQQPVAPYGQQPMPQYGQQVYVSEEQQAAGNSLLKWGILGLAFGCSFFGSILGIIFSAIALNKLKLYREQYGEATGKAKVGGILAKIGLPVSIVLTVFFFIYIIALIVAAGSYSSYHYYY